MDALAKPAIRGAGTPESVWIPWLETKALQLVTQEEICPPASRLVVVAPHPDDEILTCGGLIAMRARLGLACLVVAVTDGDASHGQQNAQARALLRARRVQESCGGLQSLGVPSGSVLRCALPDAEVAQYSQKLSLILKDLLMPSDVVITTWRIDGHPDHEATAEVAIDAAARAGCRCLQAPVWAWHWAEPDDVRVPWSSLVRLALSASAVESKANALMRHRSQMEERANGEGPVLVPTIVERALRSSEYFFV